MKKIWISMIAIFGMAAWGSLWYVMYGKTEIVDTEQSADGIYEVVLQSVGEPKWPFGSAPGRLTLKKGKVIKISETDIEIANDGMSFDERSWDVTWFDDRVEIILVGQEQPDELVILYYDGEVESCRLTTHYGVEDERDAGRAAADAAENLEEEPQGELFEGEQLITDGYQAIYKRFSDKSSQQFEVFYGANEFSSRCILSEDENTIEYLVYNGRSENEACGLYVHYQSEKKSDGSWSVSDGAIVDIYAYVYESGDVVSSGKTKWSDNGSEEYQRITGENR